MAILKQTSIYGSYAHPPTGHGYDYEVNCRVAIDLHGRESMHIRGQVSRGDAATEFVVIGHVDPGQSFLGREAEVAMDCVAVACARVVSGTPVPDQYLRRSRTLMAQSRQRATDGPAPPPSTR